LSGEWSSTASNRTIRVLNRFAEAGVLAQKILWLAYSNRLPGSVSEQHHARERKQTDEQKAEAIAFSDARRVIVQSF
jgi:hypothetical protein